MRVVPSEHNGWKTQYFLFFYFPYFYSKAQRPQRADTISLFATLTIVLNVLI